MMETELRQIVISRKEKYMKTESNITKLESDVDDLTKRIQHINLSLEKASITLKQVKKTFVVTTEKNRLMIRMMPNYKGRVGKRKSYGSGCCMSALAQKKHVGSLYTDLTYDAGKGGRIRSREAEDGANFENYKTGLHQLRPSLQARRTGNDGWGSSEE